MGRSTNVTSSTNVARSDSKLTASQFSPNINNSKTLKQNGIPNNSTNTNMVITSSSHDKNHHHYANPNTRTSDQSRDCNGDKDNNNNVNNMTSNGKVSALRAMYQDKKRSMNVTSKLEHQENSSTGLTHITPIQDGKGNCNNGTRGKFSHLNDNNDNNVINLENQRTTSILIKHQNTTTPNKSTSSFYKDPINDRSKDRSNTIGEDYCKNIWSNGNCVTSELLF